MYDNLFCFLFNNLNSLFKNYLSLLSIKTKNIYHSSSLISKREKTGNKKKKDWRILCLNCEIKVIKMIISVFRNITTIQNCKCKNWHKHESKYRNFKKQS